MASPAPSSRLLRLSAWIAAALIVALAVWQRLSFSTRFVCVLFAFLCAAALWWDLKIESRDVAERLRFIIAPLLFVASVVGVVWLLFQVWHNGLATYYSVGSLLPYSDASQYVNDAKSLINFGELREWGGRRPLGVSYIAVVLWATHQNYQWSLILLALASGVATFFAVRQTYLTGGLLAAMVYLGLCLLTLTPSIDWFMTERPGYVFASVSYAVLLSAFRRRSFREGLIGIGFLVLAQTTRPGALLTIVTASAYLVYFFSTSWTQALRRGLMVVATIVALLAIDPLLSIKICPAETQYQGNVWQSLYGLAAGGKGWAYVLNEHPEFHELPSDGARSRYTYSLFRQKLAEQPGVFVLTVIQKFWLAIKRAPLVFFGMVNGIPPLISAVFGFIGFTSVLRPMIRRATAWGFLPPVAVGVLSSAPFLFDGGTRIYLSIVPFNLALAVIPFALGVEWIRKKSETCPRREDHLPAPIGEIAFAGGLTAAVAVIALCLSFAANPQAVSSALQKTAVSSNEGLFYFNRQSGILIEGENPSPDIINVRLDDLTNNDLFAADFEPSSHILRGEFLCQALLLVRPSSNDDVVNSYIVFDRIPETRPGYLIVRLRLLSQKGRTALFKAVDFRQPHL